MFTIDLLKGRGIPIKSRPEGIAVGAVTFVVPAICAIVMLTAFISNKVVIAVETDQIADYQDKIAQHSDDLQARERIETETSQINSCMAETATAIRRNVQWSPILITLARQIPDPLLLTGLEATQRSTRIKVPDKKNPKKKTEIVVPVRTLHLDIQAAAGPSSDKQVRDFRERLRASESLGDELEDIPVSQQVQQGSSGQIISYEMNCVFKPQL